MSSALEDARKFLEVHTNTPKGGPWTSQRLTAAMLKLCEVAEKLEKESTDLRRNVEELRKQTSKPRSPPLRNGE
jgi:hypothetical protein